MNRRAFLSFLSVAPVAVPMAAQAMVRPYAGGVDLASTADRMSVILLARKNGKTQIISQYISEGLKQGWLLPSDVRKSNLRDTAEPQAPVSPDKENQFPTADQDDTRQSAHVSDTLIPNSACRLSRSWGAV